MTNTLTWIIKPIRLPKLNSNLLSVISIVLLLTMVFLTVDVIASHCEEILDNLSAALIVEAYAVAALALTYQLLQSALSSGNPYAVIFATAAVVIALAVVVAAGVAVGIFLRQLWECSKEHQSDDGTENANAGSCDSGGCVT